MLAEILELLFICTWLLRGGVLTWCLVDFVWFLDSFVGFEVVWVMVTGMLGW